MWSDAGHTPHPVDSVSQMTPILHRFTAHPATFSVGVVVLISCFGAPELWAQAALVTLGVIVFGLPHGAADPIVAWQAGVLRDNTQTTIVLTIYLALMVLALGAWIWSPGISLAFFLLVSAWHFAGDWDVLGNDIDRWVVGISMLSVPPWLMPMMSRTSSACWSLSRRP